MSNLELFLEHAVFLLNITWVEMQIWDCIMWQVSSL